MQDQGGRATEMKAVGSFVLHQVMPSASSEACITYPRLHGQAAWVWIVAPCLQLCHLGQAPLPLCACLPNFIMRVMIVSTSQGCREADMSDWVSVLTSAQETVSP